jgi:5-methylcytosine-specific restriction protein B
VFTIGQRYIWRVRNSKSSELTFGAISTDVFSENHSNFEGNPTAYWNSTNTISEINYHQINVFDAIEKELNRTHISGYSKHSKKDLEQMAFDVDFRNEILSQLDYQKSTEKPMEITITDNKIPLNQILFGAPGTGKTYNTKRIAVEIINGKKARTREEINAEYESLVNAKQIVFTTFHQSLSYEDFIEGIKPETSDGNVTYEVKDGIFKSLCQNANPKNTISFEYAYEKLQQKLAENEIIELKTPTDKTFSIALNKNGNLSLMTGSKREKQGVLTKEKLLQQLNGKEVFIDWEGYFKGVINHLKSEFNFNPESTENAKNYVLIIDEINRGNVSAIFGELITLLEDDKRKGNREQTEVTLPYSKDKFNVPNNVYIIGTMNTADRSVEALDTALRRRFSFIEMQPKPEILLDSEYQEVDLKLLLETINQRIEVLIDKDHQIGHSYFIGIQNLKDLKLIFKDKIIPLLEEYFYGDFGKIGLVLGGNFIFKEENTAKFPKNFTYENDFLEDKIVYRFTPFEYWSERTFISIYED